MIRRNIFFAAAFLSAVFAFSQEMESGNSETTEESAEIAVETEKEPKKIGEITFLGLKKTNEKYLRRVLKDFEGKEASEENLKALENVLQQEQLFEEIKVNADTSGESVSLSISLKEKISFLPLPFGAVSNGNAMFGLFVMDTNAFGVRDSFVLGGLYSASSMMGFAMYSKHAVDIAHPGFTLSASSSKSTTTISDEAENDVFEYDHKGFGAGLTITEKLGKYVSVNAGCSYSYMNSDEADDEYAAWGDAFFGIDRIQTITPHFSVGIGATDWNGVFLSQKSIGFGGSLLLTDFFDGEKWQKAQTASAKLVLQQPLFSPKFRLMSAAAAFWSHDAAITAWQGGSAANVSILPSNFVSERLAGGNAGFEWAFATSKIGTFSAYGLYECAWAQNFAEDIVFAHGPEGGMKLYLSKIAIPALSFGMAYNAVEKFWNTTFAFGVQF